jgi:trehalose/maltose hydrolase-like predicted phosphorylase
MMTTKQVHEAIIAKAKQEATALYANVQKYSHKEEPTARDYYKYRVAHYSAMNKMKHAIMAQSYVSDAVVLSLIEKIDAYKRKCYGEWPLIKGLVKGE